MHNRKFHPKRLTSALAITALAATFVTAPTLSQIAPVADAAYAKGGNGGGNGGGKGNGGAKSSSAKSKGGNGGGGKSGTKRRSGIGSDIDNALGSLFGKPKSTAPKRSGGSKKAVAAAPVEEIEPEVEVELEEPIIALRPDQKGRWNAVNANQRARDVHIMNEKWNGTVGTLALYQLAGKAASGAELNDYEQTALDNLLGDYSPEIGDGELADLLNDADDPDAPVWEVVGGTATCVANCDEADADAANQTLADYLDEQQGDAKSGAIQTLWEDAQQRIIDGAKPSSEDIHEQLLDELAHDLGFERFVPEAEVDPEADPEVVILPDDEVIVVTE